MKLHELTPRDLAVDLLSRSTCAVQCAAVIAFQDEIFAWGWNSCGPDGLGQCAEAHALSRANPSRLKHATIYIAAQRQHNGKKISCPPCERCQRLVKKCEKVIYRDSGGMWWPYDIQ